MTVFRIVMALLVAGILIYRFNSENERRTAARDKERWRPLIDPLLLVSCLTGALMTALILSLCFGSPPRAADAVRSMFMEIWLHTGLFFVAVLLFLPLLRRCFSARACATLWLLPNLLYITINAAMIPPRPLLVWRIRAELTCFPWVCLGGAAVFMAWETARHLRFRRALLRDAREADSNAQAVLRGVRGTVEEKDSLKKAPLPLLVSPAAATPLSIGLWRKTTRIVLPERRYAPDELRLILRHELIHICRKDAQTKLFLTLCTAAMWWNPLMHLAMRRCAEDLELGCDEIVLSGEPEEARARYASLLLSTAGDGRGFTTCLSATKKSLRYRLENVLHPGKKLLGGVLLGLVAAALFLSCGAVAVGYAPQRLETAIFGGAPPDMTGSATVTVYGDGTQKTWSGAEAEEMWAELCRTEVFTVTGSYNPPERDRTVTAWCRTGDLTVFVDLAGQSVSVTTYRMGQGVMLDRESTRYFFTETPPDWR